MSMIYNLLRVSGEELSLYLATPSLLEDRIYHANSVEDPALTDIDKAWDGIFFLLTEQSVEQSTHPFKKILFSEQYIDAEQDLGYGPANYLTPVQVKELNAQIATITTAQLARKYDPDKMNAASIYPSAWQPGEMCDYLLEYFESIQEVFALAAKNGEAVISFVN